MGFNISSGNTKLTSNRGATHGAKWLDPLDLTGRQATDKNAEEQRIASENAVQEMLTATAAAEQAQKDANAAALAAQQNATDESIRQAEEAAKKAEQYIVEANTAAYNAKRLGADFSNAEFSKAYDFIEQKLNPWIQSGTQANDKIQALMGFKGEEAAKNALITDPSYQFRLQQGQQALERSAAAKGGLFSGRTGAALQDYGQGMASNEFNNSFNRLMQVSEQGRGSVNTLGGYRWNLANVRSTNEQGVQDTVAQNAMNLANTRNKGVYDIAGARSAGSQNLANVEMQGGQNLANIKGNSAFQVAGARTDKGWQNANANIMQNNFVPNTARSFVGDATGVISAWRGGSGNGRNQEYSKGTSGTGPMENGYGYDNQNYDNSVYQNQDNQYPNVWSSSLYSR